MQPEETTIDEYVPDQVEAAAWDVISPLLPEMRVYFAGQNHHRLKLPAATIEVIGRRRIGTPEKGEVDADGIQQYHQVIEGSLSIKVFGGNARQHLDNLSSRFTKQTSRDLMRKVSFFIVREETVTTMNSIRDDVFIEQGAMLDVGWRYTARYYDDVGLIERVKANGTIDDVPVNFTFDIVTPGV